MLFSLQGELAAGCQGAINDAVLAPPLDGHVILSRSPISGLSPAVPLPLQELSKLRFAINT